MLTIHGTADALVPYDQAQLLDAALRHAGVPARLEAVQDKGHWYDWDSEDKARSATVVVEFLDKYLKRR